MRGVADPGQAHNTLRTVLRAVNTRKDAHRAHCLNYLRASGLKLCLLLNFGTSRVQVKRIVYDF